MKTYSGTNAGSKIRPLIDNAKESVWVITPWLGKEYAELLAHLSQKGIDVRIITSRVDYNIESIKILNACMNANLRILILDKEKTSDNSVFVHAKIYLSDKRHAISGSANLTYSGLNSNVETLSIAETEEEVQRIERDFMSLWFKYESKSVSKEEIVNNTALAIKNSFTVNVNFGDHHNSELTFYPYYFFEYILRGAVRNPPLVFEDRGVLLINGITRDIVSDDSELTNEFVNRPVTDYVLETEGKFKVEILRPNISNFYEAKELAFDYIIRKNTRRYKQYYQNRGGYGGVTGYDRLYVPRKYEISFLKNYFVSVPIWVFDQKMSDGLIHSRTVLASSGKVWREKVYCPLCNQKVLIRDLVPCENCGKLLCTGCVKQAGLIFKKKFCPPCYQTHST
ncbi:MAG: phospholipase D family protein [Candidatus Bathyarchaeota archaeon]|nr:phospholipase D family protein [Candidatus Bathyarchaeota archaeon]